MCLRASRSFAFAALLATGSLGFASIAVAQTTGTTPAKKVDPPKKADPKAGGAAAPAAAPTGTATTPATASAETKPAEPAADAEKEKEDSNRAIYISADIGFNRADVGGLSDNTGFDKTAANGLLGGIGIGYRYKDFRLGGRFRTTSTTEYTLWSLMGEIGFGLPLRPVSPTLFLHGGYIFDVGIERAVVAGSLPRGALNTPDIDLNGVVVGGEVVASYWFTKFLRMGPFIGFDALILSRSRPDPPQSIFPVTDETRNNKLFGDSGGGLGYLLNIGIRGTGDIAF
jgi:hypothetical protein